MKRRLRIISYLIASYMTMAIIGEEISAHAINSNMIDCDENIALEQRINIIDNVDTEDATDFNIKLDNRFVLDFESIDHQEDAVLVNQEITKSELDNVQIVRTYSNDDGTVVNDIVNINYSTTRSLDGDITVQRSSNAAGFTTVSLIATFDWYEDGLYSYVQCSSMAAWYTSTAFSNVVCQYFNQNKSNGYVKIGKAFAEVSYKFYNKDYPAQATNDTFKITCTDTGTVSDNGH